MNTNKRNMKMADFFRMGTSIGICAAIGVVLGAIMGNLVYWMLGGAAIGVVLGAIIELHRKNSN